LSATGHGYVMIISTTQNDKGTLNKRKIQKKKTKKKKKRKIFRKKWKNNNNKIIKNFKKIKIKKK
jgi:hypothetical protein